MRTNTREAYGRHVRRISAVALEDRDLPAVAPAVLQSWRRCVNLYHLDPRRDQAARTVAPSDLSERRERLGEFLRIARLGMGDLYHYLAGAGYRVVLTDTDGVILESLGASAGFRGDRAGGLVPGAVWSEAEQGTNGMGTCLNTGRATFVQREDHFFFHNITLTCAAAPIFDPQGRIVAALDMSGHADTAQSHALALVAACAQNIENRALLYTYRQQYILRFHRQATFISTPGEGALAFDENGRILGVNRSAGAILDHKSIDACIGRNLSTLFDVSVDELLSRARTGPFQALPLPRQSSSVTLYATVQPPWGAQPHRRAGAAQRQRPAVPQPPPHDRLSEMEFGDPFVARNIRALRRVLDRDIPILLLGETGTGKGVLARATHDASRRADEPFVAVNCAAIPEALIESELIGYQGGAFTGAARRGHAGRILQADRGTLFLDEIGDMPMSLQAHLLNVLEEKEVLPLGAEKAIKVDIQLISATHRDLGDLVARGEFREDLYYRLKGVSITLPPLRERCDRNALTEWIIARECAHGERVTLAPSLRRALVNHNWPGNIRELRSALRTMLALRNGDYLTMEDIPEELQEEINAASRDKEIPDNHDKDPLGRAEHDALLTTLEKTRWNITTAARCLGMSRRTLYRKIQRHGLERP